MPVFLLYINKNIIEMPKTVCLPDFEPATHWGWGFLERYCAQRVEPVHLRREMDIRPLFAPSCIPSDFIFGVGHGDPATFTGQYATPLWEVGKYDKSEVQGKFIKLLSCLTAQKLGPDLIKNGAKAYQGYSVEFVFNGNLLYAPIPWADPVAAKFLMPVMKSINAIINGKTNKKAFDIEYNEFTKNIEQETDPQDRAMLINDRDGFRMYGDPEAKIKPSPLPELGSELESILPLNPPLSPLPRAITPITMYTTPSAEAMRRWDDFIEAIRKPPTPENMEKAAGKYKLYLKVKPKIGPLALCIPKYKATYPSCILQTMIPYYLRTNVEFYKDFKKIVLSGR